MVGKQVELSVPVQIDADIFRDFAAFDVLQRQKRWRRPLVFALAMLVFAVICFAQAGSRPTWQNHSMEASTTGREPKEILK